MIYFNPYFDVFEDYKGNFHITLWYSKNSVRKFINLK